MSIPAEVEVDSVALASAVTGYLLCDIGKVYEVIEQMTGIAPYTHQLPRMSEELAAHVAEYCPSFPTKQEAEAFPVNSETHSAFATSIIERFTKTIKLPMQTVAERNPIAELVDMVGPEKVIVVQTENRNAD